MAIAGTFPSVDRPAHGPPWRVIADTLRRRIESGEIPSGAMLPTLGELAEEFGTSPSTAHKAVKSLAAAGLVESWRGYGSFVK